MRRRWQRLRRALTGLAVATLAAGGLAAAPPTAALGGAHTWAVTGPSRSGPTAHLDLDAAGELRLAVDLHGAPVLLPGRLGIRTDRHDLTSGLQVVGRKDRTVHE